MTRLTAATAGAASPSSSVAVDTGREEHDVREFAEELVVLSRWLGREVAGDLTAGPTGVLPVWSAFRFRDAAVFQLDEPDGGQRMYLVRGDSVRDFVVSQVPIDHVYARLDDPVLTAA